VVATGLGVVSCLGVGAAEHFPRLMAGESGVVRWAPEDRGRAGLPIGFRAPVRGFDPRRSIRNRMLRKLLQPSGAFAVAAATEAIADAGFDAGGVRTEGEAADPRLAAAALYFGSVSYDLPSSLYVPALRASFGPDQQRFSFDRFGHQGIALVDPLLIVKGLPNAALCGVSIEHGIQGVNANFANGAVAGLEAVAAAAEAIRRGDAEVALAGASDSLLQPEHAIEHHLRGRVWTGEEPRTSASRPFARGRSGYLLGEGAAVVVLESEEHARSRGARIYAELGGDGEAHSGGFGSGEEALAAAAAEALAGGPEPDVLFGQGLGTVEDDRREARAAHALFGRRVPLTAATGALGYTGAAGGIFSFAHALWSLAHGLPPTIGGDEPDPDCPVTLVRTAGGRPPASALVWASDVWENDPGSKHVAVCCRHLSEEPFVGA
jgi:3-oxoacyl-[acyl-carrier-protein] synthase II